jgi:hypothetical protein
MRKIFEEKKISLGEKEFLKYLLENYPYEGYKKEDNIIENYNINKEKTKRRLRQKYISYDNPSSTPLGNRNLRDDLTQKKGIILEYINSL